LLAAASRKARRSKPGPQWPGFFQANGSHKPIIDHPTDGYSPELLDAIEQAFEAVWTTLYARVPVEGDVARELKIELRRTLVALAAEGVTEFQELRRLALEAMALRA
jgi:hypothetical protein